MAIPKKIHYCWFGGNPLPELAQKCMASWKDKCPDYELRLWNEENFNVNTVKFTAQVARAKKWGFIVDYIRAYAIYHHGGIYMDIDVELLKPFDDTMLQNSCFSGFELSNYINPGNIFAGEKGSFIAKKVMEFYEANNFIKMNGKLNLTPSPKIFTDILLKYGLKQNDSYQELGVFTAYPAEYFCAKNWHTGKVRITEHTYAIHHYYGSWFSDKEMEKVHERWDFYAKYGNDQYLVNLFESYNTYNVNNIGLKMLYSIGIKRSLKKIKDRVFKRGEKK
jgi:mannosyltransferase OCH1-like enzyme